MTPSAGARAARPDDLHHAPGHNWLGKYPQSHAYRVLLLDAGHLGQTFHLICTALGLSPWTSAALDEATAERLLGITNPSQLVIYAAACGWPQSSH